MRRLKLGRVCGVEGNDDQFVVYSFRMVCDERVIYMEIGLNLKRLLMKFGGIFEFNLNFPYL